MERLTEPMIVPSTGEIFCYRLKPGVFEWKLKNKLGAYETAEEQGLLLRLPCKVGDTVFHRKEYAATFTGIREYQITNIMISQNKKGEWTKKYRAMMLLDGKTIDCPINFAFDDIGKTVFLTKAEAEKALAEMG